MSCGGRPRRAPIMRRVVLWVALVLVLCGPVVSVLASPGVGRASKAVGRSGSVAVVARRQRLAELDVSAAAVKLLAGNVLAGSATVGNVGSVRARSSTADVAWKSSDSGGLVQLGKFTVPALKPGQRHKARFQFDLPKGASGKYEVSVCVDVLGQVHSRKNDCREVGVITVPGSGVKASGPTSSEPSSPPTSPTAPGGSPTPPASSPPDTVIDSGPSGLIGVSSVTFTFHGSDTNDTFQCSLDGAPWVSCTSPQESTALAEGAHTFQVRAINAAGEVDPTPASASFTVEATPPQTTMTSAPNGRIPTGEVTISFASTEAGSAFQCSLDGAAYSPCSSPDVIKDPPAGPHTFKVQATNQAGVKETAGPPSASWSSVESQHDLCGTISSNTTIGPDYAARYVITCSTTIASNATLTAQPGTIVKGATNGGSSLTVEGTLDAVGTASEPITFTSINDNGVGGATGSGSPVPGDWEGIGSSGGGSIDLEHAKVSYADGAVSGTTSGTVVLKDDAFANSDNQAVGLIVNGTAPTIENNTSTGTTDNSYPAFAVSSNDLDASDLSGNTATGTGVPAFALNGNIAATSTLASQPAPWLIQTSANIGGYTAPAGLTINSGVTLTIAPGTIVKGATNGGSSLTVEGTLDAVGTASEPITFTSINDNGVGGATGSGSPVPGDWEGIGSSGGGSIDLEHAKVSYADGAVSGTTSGTVVLKDDAFANSDNQAVGLIVNGTAPTIENNTSTGTTDNSYPAFAVSSNDLDASDLSGNTATGTGVPAFALNGNIAATSTLASQPAPWLIQTSANIGGYTAPAGLTINSGVTLTIAPGTIVKGATNGGSSLTVEGTLDAVGTASEPITFTSINDNGVGGATGSGSPVPGDWEGIGSSGGGSIDLEHAKVSYADGAVSGTTSGTVVLKDDAFANSDNQAVGLIVNGTAPTIENNTSTGTTDNSYPAFAVSSNDLDASDLSGNTATGTGVPAFALNGNIAATSTLASQPAPWLIQTSANIGGYTAPAGLTINSGVTLTIAPGTIVKGATNGGSSLTVEGTLDAVGTASEPITFTSINDNGVGGATGSGSPVPGDWEGISATPSSQENPTVLLKDVHVLYATTGLAATTDKHVTVESDIFAHNNTALNISATVGTNAAIHETWFDENGMALDGSSDWEPIEPCQYIPSMSATGNEYGPLKGSKPFISKSESEEILAALAIPETEDQLPETEVGETDRITWSVLGCQPLDDDHPHVVLATPFATE